MLLKSQRSRAGIALAIGATLTALLAASAHAATIQVNSSVDPTDGSNCTLRQAIENADHNDQTNASCAAGTGGDTITFGPSLIGDTITVGSELLIDATSGGTLTIQGPGAENLEVSGGDSSRVFRLAFSTVQTANAVAINGLTISNGSVTNLSGGGIFSQGSLTLDHDVVSGNAATGSSTGGTTNQMTVVGGGIESSGGSLNVSHSQITGNTVSSTASGGSTSNTASALGAGIHASGDFAGILNIDRSSIYDNTATSTASGTGAQAIAEGGGVWLSAGAQHSIISSTIANNTLTAGGTGASTQEAGGGVEANITAMGAFAADLRDDTVTGNDAANTGANLAAAPGSSGLTIGNTIVADPSGGANCSAVTSLGHNLADDASCSPDGTTDLPSTDPSLLPLADYGGSSLTRPPDVGSPAIDAGFSEFTTDQRDLTRPFDFINIPNASGGNGADIGAVEIQAPAVVPEPTPPSAAPPATPTKKKCKKAKKKKTAAPAKKKKCKKGKKK
jgi:hypothetical protein